MKLGLHRSIIFWAGLVVMSFTVWVWWKSWQEKLDAEWGAWSVNQQWGTVALSHDDDASDPPAYFTAPFHMLSTQLGSELDWRRMDGPHFLSQRDVAGRELDPVTWREIKVQSVREYREILLIRRPDIHWILAIPHWLILGGVVLLWGVLLYGRAKWRKRALGLEAS